MKKLLIFASVILFFTQVGMASNSPIGKPKDKEKELPTGGDKMNFMMLQQAEDAMEDMNAYEITPPKKGYKVKKSKADKQPAPEIVHTGESNQSGEVESVQKKVPDTQTQIVDTVGQCSNCSATEHADDAKFCKHCGTKLK